MSIFSVIVEDTDLTS